MVKRMRIRELRKAKGLTGEQLADMVGITKGYVSELENHRKTPGAKLTMELANALGCEVYDLFEGTDEERRDAEIQAHIEVMNQLEESDRKAILKAALGLLAKPSGSE